MVFVVFIHVARRKSIGTCENCFWKTCAQGVIYRSIGVRLGEIGGMSVEVPVYLLLAVVFVCFWYIISGGKANESVGLFLER